MEMFKILWQQRVFKYLDFYNLSTLKEFVSIRRIRYDALRKGGGVKMCGFWNTIKTNEPYIFINPLQFSFPDDIPQEWQDFVALHEVVHVVLRSFETFDSRFHNHGTKFYEVAKQADIDFVNKEKEFKENVLTHLSKNRVTSLISLR